jgi:hypothetical protein
MEVLSTKKIEEFLSISSGYGSSPGSGDCYGSGYGCGTRSSHSSGPDSILGYDFGYGYGSGSGSIYGFGYGEGCGHYGDNIGNFNGVKVYQVDQMPTIFCSIHGNSAQCMILNQDFTLTPCFVVKSNDMFAHGKTLHEAMSALQDKLFQKYPPKERVAKFREEFPDFNTPIDAVVLFDWHHKLTGSCEMGRLSFCKNHNINLETDTFTVNEFIELTQNSYGGEIIKLIKR